MFRIHIENFNLSWRTRQTSGYERPKWAEFLLYLFYLQTVNNSPRKLQIILLSSSEDKFLANTFNFDVNSSFALKPIL